MCETFFLQINSSAKVKNEDTPSNFHIELPSRLHAAQNQDNTRICFQIVHVNFQGLWFLDSQRLKIKKTIISPSLPSLDTELTLDGGNYTLDTLLASINLLASDLFKLQRTHDSVTGQEHIQLINLLPKTPGIYSTILDMSFALASVLGFVLPVIKHDTPPFPRIGFLLFGCDDDNSASTASAAPSTTFKHCSLDGINIPTFTPFIDTQGKNIVFQGNYPPSLQNNLSQLAIDISSDYLLASPTILRNPNYGSFTSHHTLAFFHPHWNTLLKPSIPTTITLFPTVHQSVWLKFHSKLINLKIKDISGNLLPINPAGQTQLILKVTKESTIDKRSCS